MGKVAAVPMPNRAACYQRRFGRGDETAGGRAGMARLRILCPETNEKTNPRGWPTVQPLSCCSIKGTGMQRHATGQR